MVTSVSDTTVTNVLIRRVCQLIASSPCSYLFNARRSIAPQLQQPTRSVVNWSSNIDQVIDCTVKISVYARIFGGEFSTF